MCVIRKFWWHWDKHFIYCTRKKGPAGRNSGFLLPEKLKNCILNEKLNPFFFLWGFSFKDIGQLTGQQGMGEDHFLFHSTTSTRYIYLQLCIWDDYHTFLIPPLLFTILLLDEIYHLIELLFEWLMMCVHCCLFVCWFDFRFCYSSLTWLDYHLCITSKPTNQ